MQVGRVQLMAGGIPPRRWYLAMASWQQHDGSRPPTKHAHRACPHLYVLHFVAVRKRAGAQQVGDLVEVALQLAVCGRRGTAAQRLVPSQVALPASSQHRLGCPDACRRPPML